MQRFVKKPIVVEAVQWFKRGDCPDAEFDISPVLLDITDAAHVPGCGYCGRRMKEHVWIRGGGRWACPGDWIVKGINGEFYPVKPDIFEMTYEAV